MRRHPKAGQRVTIKVGPLKGKIFHVIDFLTAQYQGKDIKKIKAAALTTAMVNRGLPLDADTVFGQFYPDLDFGCVHDSELRVKLEEVKPTEPEAAPAAPAPDNVSSIRKNKGKKKKDADSKSPT